MTTQADIERGNPPAQDSTWETSALAAALQDDSTMSPMSELGENRDAGDKDEDTLTMKARSRRTPPALNLESA